MAKRAKGTGTLRKRTDGRWEGRIYLGKDENGKNKYKTEKDEDQVFYNSDLRHFLFCYRFLFCICLSGYFPVNIINQLAVVIGNKLEENPRSNSTD